MKVKLTPDVRRLTPSFSRFLFLSIVFFGLATTLSAQDIPVEGYVRDANGDPMIGVSVFVEGTTTGTVTDENGRYFLSAPADATLIFTYTGFTTIQVGVQSRSSIDVLLEESVGLLDEVMVVGYGAKKRSDITGSVVALQEDELREVPVVNPMMAMQGRMAGVEVQRTSSRPGAGTQIRIRGNRSLGTDESGVNDPLIVLDGIPFSGNINDINPGDIVNINVLKDASATAIYGSRGANGVILVTTRRGSDGKPRLTYNGSYGITSPLAHYDLWDGEEYADAKQYSNFGAPGGYFTPTEIENMIAGRSTDWQDVMYKNGFVVNHELGISGGTDKTQYAVGGGYFDETTVLPGQEFQRFALHLSLDQKIGDRIRIGASSYNSLSNRKGESLNPMFQILTMSPLYDAYNQDGTVNIYPAVGSVDANTVSPLTLYDPDTWSEDRRRIRTFNVLYGELEILRDLKYRINFGLDYWQDQYGSFQASETPFRNGSGSTASIRNQSTWSYTVEHVLTYAHSFGDHNFELTGLFSAQEEESNKSGFNANALFADFVEYYNFSLAESTTIPNDPNNPAFNYYRWGLLSFMARLNYDYKKRYFLTLTMRRDGSSRLAEGHKWFTYPAIAAAWNVHNESFWGGEGALSSLRIRAGFGKTSNQAVAPYSSLGSLARIPYNFGEDGGVYGFLVNSLPNDELTWEFTTSFNFGVDIGLLDNRIYASLDYYNNKTNDLLQARAIPITSGVPGSFQENIGKTKSHGFELMLSADIIRAPREGFSWSVDFNFAAHHEEIVELSEGVTDDIGNGWFVGQPVNVIYDYRKEGIWQLGEEDVASSFGDFSPGDIRVADLNGDGIINGDDREVIGQLDPKWTAGLTTRFGFLGFDLSVVGFMRSGGYLVSNLYQMNNSAPYNSLEGRRNGPDVNYWSVDNPSNDFPRTGRMNTPYGSTVGYYKADYMKIRAINLGYTLPLGTAAKIKMQSVRVYMNITNPFKAFFSDYVKQGGIDPETNGRGGTIGAAGFGRRLTVSPDTPITKTFLFGIQLSL